jgi:hypothetical protein
MLPFFSTFTSACQVLQQLETEKPAKLQQVTTDAQKLGYRYLSLQSKALYFAKAMELYNSKFINIEQVVKSLQLGHLTLQTFRDELKQFY